MTLVDFLITPFDLAPTGGTSMGWRSPVKGVRMEKIRVLLADDYIPYRWSVLAGLSNDASIEVIEEASDGEEAVRKALEYMPDVILLDLHMPICDGHEATRRILAENPHIKIIINTISESESDLETALKNGARGYLIKEGDPEQIAEAVRYVHQGGILISPSMAGKIADEFIPGGVSGQPEEPVDNEELIWDALTDEDLDSGTLTAEIAISPPVEPAEMLKLFSWLGGDLEATVEKVVPSLVKDTVLTVIFHEPTFLCRLMVESDIERNVAIDRIYGKKVAEQFGRSVRLRLTPPSQHA